MTRPTQYPSKGEGLKDIPITREPTALRYNEYLYNKRCPGLGLKDTTQQEENNTMLKTTRRTVDVQLIDDDPALEVENALVVKFKNVMTEDSDDILIQQIIMEKDIKGALQKHNETRTKTDNLNVLESTGQAVKLRKVKLKDLRWVVK